MSANTLTEKIPHVAGSDPRGPLARRISAWRSGRRASHGSWALEDNRTLRLRPGRDGLLVRCCAGTVLVTQRGDPEDHVLAAGEELRVEGRGLVVVWALSNASLTARPPRSSGSASERVDRAA